MTVADFCGVDADGEPVSDDESLCSEAEYEEEEASSETKKPRKLFHLIAMDALKFQILAETSERIKLIRYGPLHFLDSMAFLKSSLDGLMAAQLKASSGDPRKAFPLVYELHPKAKMVLEPGTIPGSEGIDLMTQKLSFAYEALTGPESYDLPALLPREAYRNNLAKRDCSDEEYAKIAEVVARLAQYTFRDLLYDYQALDGLALLDVLLAFADRFHETQGIDPLHSISLPTASMKAMLYHSKVSLELVCDINGGMDLMDRINANIRGGLSCMFTAHAKANFPSMPNYSPSEPRVELKYFDVTSLYPQ
jgi:hypothetical protein